MNHKADKARITYRFDGQGRGKARKEERKHESQVIPLYQEEYQVVPNDREEAVPRVEADNGARSPAPIILNEFRTDFGVYRSPFDEETERVERIIRESGRVNAETGYAAGLSGAAVRGDRSSAAEHASRMRDGGQQELSGRIGAEAGAGAGAGGHESGHSELYREPFASGYEGYRKDDGDLSDGERGYDGAAAYEWGEPHPGARYAKSSSTPPWTRIVLSAAGAVVTGVVFGFLVLSMFTDDSLPIKWFGEAKDKTPAAIKTDPGSASADTAGNRGTPAVGTVGANGTAGPADKTASAAVSADSLVAVNMPARSYFFLQNGIFSSAAAAQTAEAELKKKGYAAAEEAGEKTTVYAGFAMQKEEAAQLGRKLQGDKLDVFVKAVDVPAVPKLKWSGKTSSGELSAFFQQGDKLVQMIGSLTVLHLSETKLSAIEPATLDAIKSTHQTWIAFSTPVKSGAAQSISPALQQMASALNTAVVSMDEYRKNPSASFLWQAQGALMQYVLAEKGIMTGLAAQ